MLRVIVLRSYYNNYPGRNIDFWCRTYVCIYVRTCICAYLWYNPAVIRANNMCHCNDETGGQRELFAHYWFIQVHGSNNNCGWCHVSLISSQLPRAYFQSTSSAANSRNSRSREGIFSPSHDPVRETFSVPPTPPEELLNSGRVSTCRTSLSTRFERTDNIIRNLTDYVATYVPSVISIR